MISKKAEKLLQKHATVDSSEFRKHIAEFLHEVFSGKWFVITRYHHLLGVVIPLKDAARLQLLKSTKYRALLKEIDAELKN